jgi:organic hydroperoxide reductase OsmC/OhrA
MIKYPLMFSVKASANPGIDSLWNSNAAGLEEVSCAIPKEFNGPGTGYSPEDLMGMAVVNCFIATFKVFAAHAKLDYDTLDVRGEVEINRATSGQVGLTNLTVDVELSGASDLSKAKVLLDETRKNCLMANALKIQVKFDMRTT